ncbi:MAG TPA: signal peptidase I [Egibacteraceae bacterium]|nr:signal peptidase I [Egibacteraceae bacterium]
MRKIPDDQQMTDGGWSEPLRSDDSSESPGAPKQKEEPTSFLSELPMLLLVAFVLALLLKTFAVQAFFIPSESMLPGLERGDRVLVNKIVYDLRAPRRGEVVVFTTGSDLPQPERGPLASVVSWLGSGLGVVPAGETNYIKRIIGLPGETLEVRAGEVYIDGQPLPEAPTRQGGYLTEAGGPDYGPSAIPEGHYFMMGDNRPSSNDSRMSLGFIPEENVVGKAFVLIWPFTRFSPLSGADYPAGLPAARSGS